MYAVKSNIDSNGNILGIVFAESDWQQETQSSNYFDDECSGYHNTNDAESTNTLNGDGTITSDWSESWSETWDPQGGERIGQRTPCSGTSTSEEIDSDQRILASHCVNPYTLTPTHSRISPVSSTS